MSGRFGILGTRLGKHACMLNAVPLNKAVERQRIIDSFKAQNIPAAEQAEVMEALDATDWDWFVDCDGCTCVSEFTWPTLYFPPCLRHDYDCIRGLGGLAAQKRFYRLNVAYGMPPFRAWIRAAGVSIAWYTVMKWRDYPLQPKSQAAAEACMRRLARK